MQGIGLRKFALERWKLRLFLCALVLGLLTGLGEVGEPLDNMMRDIRASMSRQAPSGQVVIVSIDDRSIDELGRWPWPRSYHAELIDHMVDAGAAHVLFDVDFSSRSNPDEDRALQQALARSPSKVTLPIQFSVEPDSSSRRAFVPIKEFREAAELGTINVRYNFLGQVRKLPYALRIAGEDYSSYGAKMAGVTGEAETWFPIDYSIDLRRVPKYSAVDVLRGRIEPEKLRGRTVIVGAVSSQLGDIYPVPGYGMLAGVYIQVAGAETLLSGQPAHIGWLVPFGLSVFLVAGLLLHRNGTLSAIVAAGLALALPVGQSILESRLIFMDAVPSLLILLAVAFGLGWSSLRKLYTGRGSRNSVSGLPNLNVLREEPENPELPLIIAKVHNYAEITSAFTGSGQDALIKQIADRLALVSAHSRLYQSDDGVFAWLNDEEPETALRSLNTLHDLFRRPMLVLGTPVDVSVTFGIDGRTGKTMSSRIGSAMVAADDALRNGLKWKECDQTQLAQTTRKLSLMGQLDRAMANDEIWIAFQPKLDIATDRIIGAEALARWDHFDKGRIEPLDFILAAERSGRIAELTEYVLTRALDATAKLRRAGLEFNMAVNLSAMLIESKHLSSSVSKLLAAYGILPEQLTLEITETAALAGQGGSSRTLAKLRELGVQIAIDDYGTGLSTLEYLKRIPATELKIDKSFIQAIDHSEADRLMVQSTINLAHSLGRRVVAEGVEHAETLAKLREMGCDEAQGYLIGRPLAYAQLEKMLIKRRRAA